MTRPRVFWWTLLAALATFATITPLALLIFFLMERNIMMPPSFYFAMWPILTIVTTATLGLAWAIRFSTLPDEAKLRWKKTAQRLALWGNPIGAVVYAVMWVRGFFKRHKAASG